MPPAVPRTLTEVDRPCRIGELCRVSGIIYRVRDMYTMGAITVMLCVEVETGKTHTLCYVRKEGEAN